MPEIKLKPCPKCNGTHQIYRQIQISRKFYIHRNCGYLTNLYSTLEDAMKAWNRRVDNDT